jgi:hypothetical protein
MRRLGQILDYRWQSPLFRGVLDATGLTSANAAYSLRKVRSAYSGAAIRVRESGGNTEADIGFSANGELDTARLLAHCGANNGFVVTWYDQGGASRNLTQATTGNQPQIVSSGAVLLLNGKPTVSFTAGKQLIQSANANGLLFNASFVGSVNTASSGAYPRILSIASGTEFEVRGGVSPTTAQFVITPSGGWSEATNYFVNNTAVIYTGLNSSPHHSLYKNGRSVATLIRATSAATTPAAPITMGWATFVGNVSEIMLLQSPLTTTQRRVMEANQGAYYGVTIQESILPDLTTPSATFASVYRTDTAFTPDTTLFTDVAGTIPVTAIGDLVACWKSSVGSSMMTQATSTKRPSIQRRSDGKYVLRFDGIDDELTNATGLITPGATDASFGSSHAWTTVPTVFEGVWHTGPLLADQEAALINNGGGANRVRIHTGSSPFLLDTVNFISPSGVIYRTQSGNSNLIIGTGSQISIARGGFAIGAGTQYFGNSPAGNFGDFDIAGFFAIQSYINDTDRTRLKTWLDANLSV